MGYCLHCYIVLVYLILVSVLFLDLLCDAIYCLFVSYCQELEIAHVNVSDNCPDSDCPEKTVPMGRCCPVCLCECDHRHVCNWFVLKISRYWLEARRLVF